MELNDAIFHRRSVRSYTDREVDSNTILQLLNAAIQAPSGVNQQPWAFGIFRGRERLRAYSERAKAHLLVTLSPLFELHPRSQMYAETDVNIFHGAGTLVVIYAQRGKLHPTEDCCLAAQNLMLAAHGMGLATCPVGYARDWLNLHEVKAEFGVADDITAVFPLVLGYPAGPTPPPPRREPVIVSWL